MELTEVIISKLHSIQITESNLNYHGSITIDSEILRASGMRPMQFVYIWNKSNGTRISTYIIPGKEGSGEVCLNGAAARCAQVGDEVIITQSALITPDEYSSRSAKVLTFKHNLHPNEIDKTILYELKNGLDDWEFNIIE